MDIAISVRQPWAALIVLGFKPIENRTWAIPNKHLGQRVSIHAGLQPDKAALEYPGQPIREAAMHLATFCGTDFYDFEHAADANPDAFQLGGIVGRVTLKAHILNGSKSPWANNFPNTWHWQLVDAKAIPFVACKGALGFFKPVLQEALSAKPVRARQKTLLDEV